MNSEIRAATALATATAFLSLVILILSMPRDLGVFDEGIILVNAMRVLHGDIVHRDFYSSYGPAQYALLAGVFKVFGQQFIVARLYDLTIRASVLAALFFVIHRRCGIALAVLFTAIAGMLFIGTEFYLYPIFPCMLLSLIGSYLILGVDNRTPFSPRTIGAGFFTGFAALFRYDAGFFLLVANLSAIAILIVLSGVREMKPKRVLAAWAAYIVGTAIVFVPVAIAFLLSSPVQSFIADIIEYPIKYYGAMRRLPFPGFQAVRKDAGLGVVYLPILAAGLAAFEVLKCYLRRRASDVPRVSGKDETAYLVAFGTTMVMLSFKGIVRVSPVHMLLAIIPSLVVCAILIKLWWQAGKAGRVFSSVLLIIALVPAAKLAGHEAHQSLNERDRSIAGWLAIRAGLIGGDFSAPRPCEEAPGSGIAKLNDAYARVATYLNEHTRPEERILAALDRHDKILQNPVSVYFASGRLPSTHWHQFDPGLQTRADIQTAMIGELQRKHVRYVVRDGTFDGANEPNGSASSSGVVLLDQFLDQNYLPVASSGKVTIWLTKAETPEVYSPLRACEPTRFQPSPHDSFRAFRPH